jgi:hypothetical protein
MRRLKPLGVLILIPAVCLLFSAPGCGKKEEPAPAPKGSSTGDKGRDKGKGGNGAGKKTTELTELDTQKWGKLSGTVTYDGDPPTPKKINMEGNQDEKKCHDTKDERQLVVQTWLVNKENKGVSDVVIFLRPPEGKYFKVHEDYKKNVKEPVLLHQPHCAFIPHSFPYWASSYDKDSGDQKPSGKQIRVLNDAQFNHNTAWSGDPDLNPKGSVTLEKGKDRLIKFAAQDSPIGIKCDIHTWMSANCWALDHPYAARTDKDGKFVIEHVPAGVELRVVAWHEGAKYCYGGESGTPRTFVAGDNNISFKIK